MIRILTFILELPILVLVFWTLGQFLWQRYGSVKKGLVFLLAGCAALIAISVAQAAPIPTRLVTLTGLNEKGPEAKEATVYLETLQVDGIGQDLTHPETGAWTTYGKRTCWFSPDDERRAEGQTDSVSYRVPAGSATLLNFYANNWKGKVLVQTDGFEEVVDTFQDSGDNGRSFTVSLPTPSLGVLAQTVLVPLLWFSIALVLLSTAATGLLELCIWALTHCFGGLLHRGPFRKLAEHQFLFEELVKRDFKKKYKRTVLGMAWSILSPLLMLLVMRLVFTQFFGRQTAHYTTYLFCGNLVFSYFNEATSQGMTSLMGNSHIFTKVNVPKYLFLFSKNVQTLINFGLTLCVFFVFCVLDNITFTWKLLCLVYPIICLVLFNIGVGLILSALFVFFRDIQYLWSVFTQLLMYMSAIFYTIDNYPTMVQNLFLVNPVYLFIRYFRKVVIDTTIPSLWFHLLMLADVVIVLGVGFWIYKKNNTKFLYYV